MTIRHLFLWSTKDPEDGEYVLAQLAQVGEEVPGLLNWGIGPHAGEPAHSAGGPGYDYALTCDFPDRDALDAYQVHPAHASAVERVMPLYGDWAVVDLEL